MKARVKATGEIVEIAEYSTIYAENHDTCFYPSELVILDTSDDYWARLEHTYAGIVMQSMLQTMPRVSDPDKYMKAAIDWSVEIAHALVEKYKEKEEER